MLNPVGQDEPEGTMIFEVRWLEEDEVDDEEDSLGFSKRI